ncbi:ANTAR domain-containing protein [Rhodococcus qingshengii]|uniref:ANTAR domain-containing protein n=1 Tax=Rhodococcus qingshengii TaxID=334542 RepID=UPI001F2E82CE|nr:ANTAR domain-containing protein [Rhodococcus qingshengii]
MHGGEPGAIAPTTELLLSHNLSDHRPHVAETLEVIRTSVGSFGSRHRIVDTRGTTRWVVVVGDRWSTSPARSSAVPASTSMSSKLSVTRSSNRWTSWSPEIASSRAAIERAKGMLMLVCAISADRALDVLTWHSQETSVKVRDVAERLLTGLATDFHMPDAVRTHFDHVLLGL